MADKKISALTAATTPLAGTEVLPIVQSGATVKVSVDNLTTGKAVTGASFKASSTSANFYAEVPDGSGGGQALMKAGDAAGRYFAMRGTSYDYDPAFLTSVAASVTMKNLAAQATSMTWGSTGDITLNVGNLIQGTAAKGVNFTANTPAAGMTSQLLNWYEEGTWTPTAKPYSGSITPVGTTKGTYTRVGRQVTVFATVPITDNGTGSVVLLVQGLPFSQSTATVAYYAGCGENRGNGKALSVELGFEGGTSTPTLFVYLYDGTYPVASGQTLVVTCTYNV